MPDHPEPKNANIANILDDAHSQRTARFIRRQIAAHQVQQCESSLRLLREDLQHADRDLEEADSSIGLLQDLFQQHFVAAPDPSTSQLTTFYDSGASDRSASSDSDDSIADAVG
jgi:hypothetical protein